MFPPQFRQRAVSQPHNKASIIPQIGTPLPVPGACSSTSSTSSSPVERKRNTRKRTPPSDPESERVTGHVLASGHFMCAKLECADLRFGRQADFRRHHTNVHAKIKKEYFCTFSGCARSKTPSNKSKGRSFGNRKDKMEEHVQTVHHQGSKKRKRPFEPESDPDEEAVEFEAEEEEDAQSDI
ncbi:hypothetical protein E8E11_004441 [Didymella keratinophila]|nr:hypothetical protein E8E11_004441 [Didymella keratinophila]